MVEREWSEKVDLGITDRVDWSLLRRTVLFARKRVPTPTHSRFFADLPDSTVRSDSFEDLRDAVEPEGEVATYLEMTVADDRLRINWLVRVGFGRWGFAQMSFTGPDRDRVLGAAAALERELPEWRDMGRTIRGKEKDVSASESVTHTAIHTAGLRRHLTDPNPWVLIVGGTVIGGVIVGLFTNWFGLG